MAHLRLLPQFLLLVVSVLSHLSSASVIINDDYSIFQVDRICKGTQDYNFCSQALNSDPRTPTADLTDFAQISLDLTSRNASDTSKYISQLIGKIKDPVEKGYFGVCIQSYKDAINGVGEGYKLLQSKSYEALKKEAEGISGEVVTCEDSWKGKTSPLTSRNHDLKVLAIMAGVVADFLEASS